MAADGLTTEITMPSIAMILTQLWNELFCVFIGSEFKKPVTIQYWQMICPNNEKLFSR